MTLAGYFRVSECDVTIFKQFLSVLTQVCYPCAELDGNKETGCKTKAVHTVRRDNAESSLQPDVYQFSTTP